MSELKERIAKDIEFLEFSEMKHDTLDPDLRGMSLELQIGTAERLLQNIKDRHHQEHELDILIAGRGSDKRE